MMRLMVVLLCLVTTTACGRAPAPGGSSTGETHGAFAAISGVTRTDALAQQPQIIARPMSGDVEILYGDPEVAGEHFVMRIRELPGTRIPPSSRPVDEHITVVEGTWYFALGEVWDSTALAEMGPGAYAFAPKGSTMFGYSPAGAVVQVHGAGPFHIHWRDGLRTLDDAGAAAVFRHRKGEHVSTQRGSGRIRQGYASGAIVQYEVEGDAGALFMADQAAVRRP